MGSEIVGRLGWPRLLILAVYVLLLAGTVWWLLAGSAPVNARIAVALVLSILFIGVGNFIYHLCRGFAP